MRERQEEFETESAETIDASTSRRPDAVSLSYLTRFAPGPIALSDPTDGLLVRSWKARVSNATGEVLIARANDENDGWDDEVLVFEFEPGDNEIVEMAFAFNQNGDPNFACEREDGNVWVRYFQAGVGAIFDLKGPGRTPVVILDDPTRPEESEVLAWYIEGGTLRYRSQLSNYNTEVDTGVAMGDDHFLEGAIRTRTRRVELAYSVRDEDAGTWDLRWLLSHMYPHEFEDAFGAAMTSLAAELREMIVAYTAEEDEVDAGVSTVDAVLQPVVVDEEFTESLEFVPEVLAGAVVSVVVTETPPTEPFDAAISTQAAELEEILVEHDVDVEEVDLGIATVSAVLT